MTIETQINQSQQGLVCADLKAARVVPVQFLVFEHLRDGVLYIKPSDDFTEKRFTYSNPGYANLPITTAETVEKTLIQPRGDGSPSIYEAARTLGQSGRIELANGDTWYNIDVTAVPNPATQENDVLVTVRDITEHKLAMIKSAAELAARNSRIEELQEEIKTGQQREQYLNNEIRRREDLEIMALHETKNPLQSALASAQLSEIALLQDEPNIKKALEHTKVTIRSIKKGANIIMGDLEGVKEAEKENFEAIGLQDVMISVLKEFLDDINIRDVNLELVLPDPKDIVWGSRRMLISVFRNLISNSLKYMKDSNKQRLSILSSSYLDSFGKKQARIYFKDTGKGIAEERREEVFKGDSDSENGNGKGLQSARGFAMAHGGRIQLLNSTTAEMLAEKPSLKETGSTIYLELPLHDLPKEETADSPTEPQS